MEKFETLAIGRNSKAVSMLVISKKHKNEQTAAPTMTMSAFDPKKTFALCHL